MKIINFKGGLGNQMFQYAFARCQKYKEEFLVPNSIKNVRTSVSSVLRKGFF